MKPVILDQIELYNALLSFKKLNGNDALAALLRKLGVKSPHDIDAARFSEVQMLCKAGVVDLDIVEGEDEATGASEELTRLARSARGAGSTPDAMNRMGAEFWNRRKTSDDAPKSNEDRANGQAR